jgi:hypothetical protein
MLALVSERPDGPSPAKLCEDVAWVVHSKPATSDLGTKVRFEQMMQAAT